MKVIVDTSVWSLAPRRRDPKPSPHCDLLHRLIVDHRTVLLGVIRQELLLGIRFPEQYQGLKSRLRAFPDLPMETQDHETAAGFFNICMSNGVCGTPIDLLICATAHRRGYRILTTDPDFDRYAACLSIELLSPQ